MSTFTNLRIAAKLFIGFGALILLLIAVSGVALVSDFKFKTVLDDVIRHDVNETLDQRAQKNLAEAGQATWMALATGDAEHWREAARAMQTVDERLAALAASTKSPSRAAKVVQLTKMVGDYKTLTSRFTDVPGRNEALQTDDGKALTAAAIKMGADTLSFANALAEDYGRATATAQADATGMAAAVEVFVGGLALVSLLIGATLALVTAGCVRRPIEGLTRVMGALAKGDLGVSIPKYAACNEIGEMARAVSVFRDAAVENQRLEREALAQRAEMERQRECAEQAQLEAIGRERAIVAESVGVGLSRLAAKDLSYRMTSDLPEAYRTLQADFNSAIAQLQEAMTTVATTTTAIYTGTQEISTASQDMSRRTETQAASLEETAAALEEITATVKQSAEGTLHVREFVASANEDADKSATVVRQTVEAMNAIAKSAEEIGRVIGVIDEIAFQTNLLALNAGVEAARAGDAGRGFAVVASEVRALAQRSAQAAKEIKALVSTSEANVGQGVKLVGETGASLERMMAEIRQITEVVVRIAAGAKEQATGIGEVNVAIGVMDQATQQNAAMAEESTAAARSLELETEHLQALVGQFRIASERRDASQRGGPRRAALAAA